MKRAGILVGLWAALLAGCAPGADRADDGRLHVVTTVGMIEDLARRVGGEHVRVEGLMGPGVDPHLYRASEGDVRRLSRADLILYNGLHLEARMGDVLEQMGDRVRTVAVSDAVARERLMRPPEFEGAFDPHIWFDVSMWRETVPLVRDVLSELDPGNAEDYARNAEGYLTELDALHGYVLEQAGRLPAERRVLVTAHDAFNYFGRAYGFEVRGLQGISTATEAGTADVQRLAAFIAERAIPAIFVEASIPRRTIEAVQAAVRARGAQVAIGGELFSDSLGDAAAGADSYVGMVRHNIDTLVRALGDEH